jgi:hypothetical protein
VVQKIQDWQMAHISEDSDVLSIDFDSDDLPICEPISGTRRFRDSSSGGSQTSSSTEYAESDGQVIEPNSVTDLYPEVIDLLTNSSTMSVIVNYILPIEVIFGLVL